jgi:hypothetical protein
LRGAAAQVTANERVPLAIVQLELRRDAVTVVGNRLDLQTGRGKGGQVNVAIEFGGKLVAAHGVSPAMVA